MADHPLFAHQLEAARKAKELAELEVTGGHIIRAGYRRRPLPEEQIKPRAAGRYTGLDLWAPSPLVDFERNSTNYRIPTLLITPVAKIAVPRGPQGETLPDYPDPQISVIGHYGYIERQERATRALAAVIEPEGRPNRAPDDYGYTERRDARDVSELGDVSHISTNIDANPEARKAFARAVYRHERLGKNKHKLLAGIDDLGWWIELAAQPGAQAWVREAVRRLRAYERQLRAKADAGGDKKVIIAEVTERQAYDRLVWCQTQPGWNPNRKQATFQSNIGGRVQYRFVFQLPYWISAGERLEIVHKMARMMGKMGFMYVAAIHRPDPHNDPRNYHVHIDAYDRPCKYNKKLKLWDIEIFERKRNGSAKPTRQPKIVGFARPAEKGAKHFGHWAGVIRNFRNRFCAFTNEVLEQSPTLSPLRYHPGPFEAIGLNLRATGKLGGARMAKEANGVRTSVGDDSALNIWSDVFDAIYRKRKEAIDSVWKRSRSVTDLIANVADGVVKHELEREWARLRQEELDLIERRFRFELAQAEIAMMKSRAETIIREAGRRGVGRDEGKSYRKSSLAPLRDVAMREAEAHIALVDTFAPTKEAVAAEIEGQGSEKTRLEEASKVLLAAIIECDRSPPRGAGIKRLSPTSVRLPLEQEDRPPTRAGRYDKLEIERLMSWFDKHSGEREHFLLEEGTITITARQAVCTRLIKHFHNKDVFDRVLAVARELDVQGPVQNFNTSDQTLNLSPGETTVPAPSADGLEPKLTASNEVQVPLLDEAVPPHLLETGSLQEPIYLREDRVFMEEESNAQRPTDGKLLGVFRHFMTAEKPAFYLDRNGATHPSELLSFKEPEAVEIVGRWLREAAADDQVLRYIHRMMPTLPLGDPQADNLIAFAVAPLQTNHVKSPVANRSVEEIEAETLAAAHAKLVGRGR